MIDTYEELEAKIAALETGAVSPQTMVETLRETYKITSILYRISNAVSTTNDLFELFESIHDILKKHIDATNFFISLVNEEKNRLDFPYYKDEADIIPMPVKNINDPQSSSLTLEVVRTGRPLFGKVEDMLANGIKALGSLPKVWLGIPLKIKDKVIGAMAVQHYSNPDHYSEKDVQLMVSASEQIALAIERKIHEDALRENENIKTILYRISNAVSTTRNLDDLFMAIHQILEEFIGAKNLFIALVDPKNDLIRFPYFKDEADAETLNFDNYSQWQDTSPTISVIKDGKFLFLDKENFLKFPSYLGTPPEAWLGVPLKIKDTSIGAIVTQDYHNAEKFSQEDINIMVSVSEHIAWALERKINEDEIRESKNIASILYQISNAVSTTRDLYDLFQSIHYILRDHIDATNFFIALVDYEKDHLSFPYFKDEKNDIPYVIKHISQPEITSLIVRVIKTGKPLFKTVDRMKAEGLKMVGMAPAVWLGVPLKSDNKVLGAMAIQHYSDPKHYTEKDVHLLTSVSEQVALAIERKMHIDTIKKAKMAADRANNAKSQFLANMSHEIRTPLNGVIGMIALLLDSALSAEQKEYAETIQYSADSLLSLINDILDYSKIEAGLLEFEKLDFDIATTLENSAEFLTFKALEKGLKLACKIDANVPVLLKGDPGRIRQILINLGSNAIKFTEKGEIEIHLSLIEEDGKSASVKMAVKDTGIGIPQNRLNRLFKSFSQVDSSTTRKYGGTGLGLAICKQLAEMMGGEIGLKSTVGQGSLFWFTATLEKQPVSQKAFPELPPEKQQLNILVVVKNAIHRKIIELYLNDYGCRYHSVETVKEALSILSQPKRAPFDTAIIENSALDANGELLGQAVKSNPKQKPVFLILMTSPGIRQNESHFKGIGFNGYLTKPIKRLQLHTCLINALGQEDSKKAGKTNCPSSNPMIPSDTIKKANILLAEDNIVNQKLSLALLEKFGFKADAVKNGKEAIQALSTTPYDLILMDIQMPEMDGIEAAEYIRNPSSEVLRHDIPIIAMTAHALAEDRARCIQAGMNDYISKPITPFNLLEVIESNLT